MTSVFTIANLLTILRLILIPVFVTAIFYQKFLWALTVFFIAALTDGLDGLVARAFNQKTPLGEILDPMADKLLLVTAFIVLSMEWSTQLPPHGSSSGIAPLAPLPFWLTAAVISRDIFIVLGALVINITTGLNRFPPSVPGKLNTLIQVLAIVAFLTANALHHYPNLPQIDPLLPPLYYLTLGMAVFSGLHYIYHVNRNLSQRS
jgi:cardiolipin synthase (CMP-forming)